MRVLSLVPLVLVFACSVPDLTAVKQCPCADGWRCDELTNQCFVPLPDGGVRDLQVEDMLVDVRREDTDTADATGAMDAADDAMVDAGATVDADAMMGADAMVDADATVDADAMPPPSYCEGNNPILCEDFDSIDDWSLFSAVGVSVEVDNSIAYRGDSSLRVQITERGAKRTLRRSLPTAIRASTIYVRAYLYVEDVAYQNISWITIRESDMPFGGASYKIRDTGAGMSMDVDGTLPGPLFQRKGGPVARDTWTCWQGEIQLATTATGSMSLSVDGALLMSEVDLVTEPMGGMGFVGLGAIFSDEPGPATYWVDEFVFDTSPIPCD